MSSSRRTSFCLLLLCGIPALFSGSSSGSQVVKNPPSPSPSGSIVVSVSPTTTTTYTLYATNAYGQTTSSLTITVH
jgi:hypothetical protein